MNSNDEDSDKSADPFSALAGLIGSTPEHAVQSVVAGGATFIGPFKLLEQIGEGGMGVVYAAEQTEPVRRKVALKIIKPGMASGQVIARFEAERQALAMMDHPSIAKVFDAGTTSSGQPYFAMEFVDGVPITKYCDSQKLSLRQRLELFVQVCKAIQHAHQKGIIHRDIKPSNVLVALHDGKPVPKVIDFGVAKVLNQKLTDATLNTQAGALVGTLEYMSPEQAEMNAMGIDARSDIYSLGVLLYEILTGSTPLNRKLLRDSALDELLRRIREEEPPKPSTRLTTANAEELTSIAQSRNADQTKLSRQLKGDLDWIAMRALEKDRTRRYESANGLARDVERYLSDEPVEACPPSKWYRVRKFTRRNRILLSAASIALTVCVVIAALFISRERINEKERKQKEIVLTSLAQEALREQQRLKFEADVRSAEANDESGESAKIVATLEPYLSMPDLVAGDLAIKKAAGLLEKARADCQRAASFADQIRKGERSVALDLGAGVTLELLLIPAGKFLMGSPKDEALRLEQEGPRHEVIITKPFYIGKFELTQEQYERVMSKNPSEVRSPKNPVENTSWNDAQDFCRKLSARTSTTVRLPTEAEWEYACRAGTTTRFSFGDSDNDLHKFGNYADRSNKNNFDWQDKKHDDGFDKTSPVGSFKPNSWGLYDMHGNVKEWCQDYWSEKYPSEPQTDPTGPAAGENRVLRSGCWWDGARHCRSATRAGCAPICAGGSIGFRVVVQSNIH